MVITTIKVVTLRKDLRVIEDMLVKMFCEYNSA